MSEKEMSYEEYMESCEQLMDEFEQALKEEGISQRTINRHLSAVEVFIEHFLPGEGSLDIKAGLWEIDTYLCYWGVKKVFSSPSNITTEASGIKKFYKFLLSRGDITKEEYQEFAALVKNCMPKAKAALRDFFRGDFDPYGEKDLF